VKKVLILALALVLLVGIAAHGTFGLFSDTETSTGNTFTAWVEEVVCAKFNVSDKLDAKIYKYDDTGAFAGSFDLSGGNEFPLGVAAVGDYVYVVDHADKQVYKYTCSGTLVEVSKVLLKADGSSVGNIDGLAIDIIAGEMWVLSGNKKNIYYYPLSAAFSGPGDINAAQEITLDTTNNKGAIGLAIDTSSLYVLDSADHQFYRYLKSDGSVTVSKVLKGMGGGALGNPAGAMLDGTSLWVVDNGTDKMYEYDIVSLFPDGGTINAISEFPLHPDNADASGL